MAQWLTKPTRNHEVVGSIPGLAVGPIKPLAWELPYAAGVALEKTERQKKKKRIYQVTFIKTSYQ